MKTETRQILSQFDEVGRFETPTDFNYDNLILQIKKLKAELEFKFKVKFNIADQIQDASFICDLIIPDELLIKKIGKYVFTIRFSNFGKLVTVNGIENLNIDIIKKLKIVLKNNNFIFIEPNEIDIHYDGKFENFKNIFGEHTQHTPSWFTRYFDYL